MSNTDWANLTKYHKENLTISNTSIAPIVFMGDSITEFWSTYDTTFFGDNGFINRGISGQTTPQMLLRFRQDVINLKPSTVVILAGINDIAENTGPITTEQIMENIISMTELAKANDIKVILCAVLPANKFDWNKKLKPADQVIALNRLIKKYALEKAIPFVDYYAAMVDESNGLHEKYGDDGVHPNAQGYQIMKQLILKTIQEND
jgi:lysophospholipase L1-like esterase